MTERFETPAAAKRSMFDSCRLSAIPHHSHPTPSALPSKYHRLVTDKLRVIIEVLIRRIAHHVMDHAWEMEDRDTA